MKASGQKSARVKHGTRGPGCQTGSCSLLALPVEVLHQVLNLLDPRDLMKLLRTSKTMAVEVVQHSAGKVTFKVQPCTGAKLAAVRNLQWAPPSTLKLLLASLSSSHDCYSIPQCHDWDSLMRATQAALPALSSRQDQHSLQFPCFSEVCIQGFTMPELVPASLTTMCPNLQTLLLSHCTIQHSTGAISKARGKGNTTRVSSGSTGANDSTGAQVAAHLHTLVLQCVKAPCLKTAAAGSARATTGSARVTNSSTRVTRSLHAAEQYREQLRSSLPRLACLELVGSSDAGQIVSMFGPQLTELRLSGYLRTSDMQWWHANICLQQLQKLVLPNIQAVEADVKQLLCLPNVIHVELGQVMHDFKEDYSSYPCKWQTLHLHMNGGLQHIRTLAKLPLHSLVQPLKLGCQCGEGMQLQLPSATEDNNYHGTVELIAQRLRKCGVQVLEPQVSWACDDLEDDYLQGFKFVDAMTTIGPVFGLHARVSLVNLIVDQPILEALATVYGASLQQLVLEECAFQDDMLPAWHAALSGLPALRRLELIECEFDSGEDEWDDTQAIACLVRHLAAAMAQQPDGRCVEVRLADACGYGYYSSDRLADLILDGAEALLMDVEVTPQDVAEDIGSDDDSDDEEFASCVCITSKHTSS